MRAILAWYLPALLLLSWFLPSFYDMGFSWDDREALLENPSIRNFDVVALLGEDYWEWHVPVGAHRPLSTIMLALELRLFGDGPIPLHRVTLLLHGLCVLALAAALSRWRTGLLLPALLLLFFHPTSAEQAVWISGCAGSLVLGLGGLCLYVALGGLPGRSKSRPTARLWAAALSCLLAALAREDGLVFLVVAFVLLPVERRRPWLLPATVVVLVWGLLRWLALGELLPAGTFSVGELPKRFGEAAHSFGHSAAMLLLVERPRIFSVGVPSAGLFVMALPLFLVLLGCSLARRWPSAKGLAWTLLAFLPLSHLVPFSEGVAGRYAYPLLPGLALAVFVAVARTHGPPGSMPVQRFHWLMLVPLALVPFWLTQVRVLSEERRAYEQVLEVEPDNRRALLMLSLAEERGGEIEAAIARLRELRKRHPNYSKAAVNLGRLLMQSGQHKEAERVLSDAVFNFPRSVHAPLTLGRLLYDQKRYDEAADAFLETLQRNPRQLQALRYLCRAYIQLDDREKAGATIKRLRSLNAKDPYLPKLEEWLDKK